MIQKPLNINKNIVNSRVTNFDYTGIGVLNMFLLTATIFLVIYYVFISNMTTASNYKVGTLNDKLSELMEFNGLLTAKKLSVEDSSLIFNFAQNHNMVEARSIVHIFENGGVALQK